MTHPTTYQFEISPTPDDDHHIWLSTICGEPFADVYIRDLYIDGSIYNDMSLIASAFPDLLFIVDAYEWDEIIEIHRMYFKGNKFHKIKAEIVFPAYNVERMK